MGQPEILKLLKKEKKWLSSKQIAEKLGNSSAMRPLQVLLKSKDIIRRHVKVNNHNEYQWKNKMKTNTIIQGDAIKVLKTFPEESIDLIVTDPPYNIGINYGKNKDKLSQEDYIKWCTKWLKECERVLKENGSIYIINYPESNARVMCEINRQTKLLFKRWIMWFYPTNIGCSPKNWTRASRSILFYTKGNKYKFNLKEGEVIDDFIEFNLVKNTSKEKIKGFPNQIPEKLMKLLIELSSNKRDLVLDPFIGSGTTAVVCKKNNREFLGIELNPKYVKIANKRLLETRK